MDNNAKYRLEDLFFVIDQNTGNTDVYIENMDRSKAKNVSTDEILLTKSDSGFFMDRYGIDRDNYEGFTGIIVPSIMNEHKKHTAICMPKLYFALKTMRPATLSAFAYDYFMTAKDVEKISRLVSYDYIKKANTKAKKEAKKKAEKDALEAKIRSGRDF